MQKSSSTHLLELVLLKRSKLPKMRSGLAVSVFLLLMSLALSLTFEELWKNWQGLLLTAMVCASLACAFYATQLDNYRNAKDDLFTHWLLLENQHHLQSVQKTLEKASGEQKDGVTKELLQEFKYFQQKIARKS